LAKARTRKKKPVPAPSKRWGWSYYHDTRELIKFSVTAAGGFLAGFGGLFATSDNASRLMEAKGWYAALGLTALTVVKWAQLLHRDNTPDNGTNA
jgi:hypothetical protein